MSAEPQQKWTPEAYLDYDRGSELRHEFLNGEVFAMVGASENHSWILANTITTLHPQLVPQGCRIYPTDMRVKVNVTGLYTYPDLVIVCGERNLEGKDTLLNPTVLMEILSPSTEKYDRGRKFIHYQAIPSMQSYLLISQDDALIEQYLRTAPDRWEYTKVVGLDAVMEITPIHCTLPLASVYQGITFEPDPPAGEEKEQR